MDPTRVLLALDRDFDHDLGEGLARRDPLDRIIVGLQPMIIPVAQAEAAAILVHRPTQLLQAFDPVHRQRGIVRPEQALVGVDQNHPLVQPRDDLSQVPEVGGIPHGGERGRQAVRP